MMDDNQNANNGGGAADSGANNAANAGGSAGEQVGQLTIPDAVDAAPTQVNADMDDSEDEEE